MTHLRLVWFAGIWAACLVTVEAGDEPSSSMARARQRLAQCKVAVNYESITDGATIGRPLEQTITLLKETGAGFVFRAFMQGPPVLESPQDFPPELTAWMRLEGLDENRFRRRIVEQGYSYQSFAEAATATKRALPGVLICGGIPTQWINTVERNPLTGKTLTTDKTWALALDPSRWGVRKDGQLWNKEEFQKFLGLTHGWVKSGAEYDHRKAPSFYPDLTQQGFQELVTAWAGRQIDAGAEAVWIDLLYTQAAMMGRFTGEANHAAVRDACDAAGKVVRRIHEYAAAKGKYVLVGTWAMPVIQSPFDMPELDFVTLTPSQEEVAAKKVDERRWLQIVAQTHKRLGEIPILVFLDCFGDHGVLAKFSQSLDKQEQRQLLEYLDGYCRAQKLLLAYPLHGGGIGGNAKIKSFGKSDRYDSLAPEFDTYSTIRALSQRAR
jgi:hypothetical protein